MSSGIPSVSVMATESASGEDATDTVGVPVHSANALGVNEHDREPTKMKVQSVEVRSPPPARCFHDRTAAECDTPSPCCQLSTLWLPYTSQHRPTTRCCVGAHPRGRWLNCPLCLRFTPAAPFSCGLNCIPALQVEEAAPTAVHHTSNHTSNHTHTNATSAQAPAEAAQEADKGGARGGMKAFVSALLADGPKLANNMVGGANSGADGAESGDASGTTVVAMSVDDYSPVGADPSVTAQNAQVTVSASYDVPLTLRQSLYPRTSLFVTPPAQI